MKSEGLAAWDERCTHIEKHFKDGKRINEWIRFDDSSVDESSDHQVSDGAARNEMNLDDRDPRPSTITSLGGHGREVGPDLTTRRDRSLPNEVTPGLASAQPPREDVTRREGGSKKHSRTDDLIGNNNPSKVARMQNHGMTELIICVSGSYNVPGPGTFYF